MSDYLSKTTSGGPHGYDEYYNVAKYCKVAAEIRS